MQMYERNILQQAFFIFFLKKRAPFKNSAPYMLKIKGITP